MIRVVKVGDWAGLRHVIAQLGAAAKPALQSAIRQEAEFCRGQMVTGIVAQSPGGKAFQPLAKSTLQKRQLAAAGRVLASGKAQVARVKARLAAGQRSAGAAAQQIRRIEMRTAFKAVAKAAQAKTKALIVNGDLVNAIRVVPSGDGAFIGVLRTARARGGKSLCNIARIHEFGAGPKAVRMTPRQRRYLHAMYRQLGYPPRVGRGGGGVFTVRIPARPFVRPVYEALYRHGDAAQRRILASLEAYLRRTAR
jgi:hypothetical protein